MDAASFSFDRIMIIDDDIVGQYAASFTIRKFSFAKEAKEFDLAIKGIEFLEQNQNNPEMLPQFILLDVNMPEMNGLSFSRGCRICLSSSMPVAVLSCSPLR